MKKSKVIVPALGLLILSTAASVSGTVAWFTAVRQFNANISSFAVVKTTADLECQFTGLIGTTEANGSKTNDVLNVDANTVLTDGSFDYSSKKVAYPLSASGDRFAQTAALGFATKGVDEAVDGIDRGKTLDNKQIFTVFSWKMTFTYSSQTNSKTGLFINFDTGKTAATASVDKPTKAGFRVAFVNVANGRSVVWAPFRVDADTTELKYVSSVDAETKAASTTALVPGTASGFNCITGSKTGIQALANVDDGVIEESALSSKTNYIGTFNGSSVTSLVYNCVAWYEGADSAVVSSNDLATISLALSFDARQLKAS